MKTIIKFFAKEHLFGNLITILVIAFGLYSLFTIRRDIWPEVNLHVTTIRTILNGASAEQVEKLVINPIEAAIKEVDGLKKVNSTATENIGVVVLRLDPDARDPDETNSDIQRVIDRVDDLPEDATKPVTTIIDSAIIPVIEVTVSKNADPMVLRDTAKDMADEISLMTGVARVAKQGYRKKEYLVEADPFKLAARNIGLRNVINAIHSRNISLPGGSVENQDGVETMVRTEGQYETADDLTNTLLVANQSGYGTRLGEVAKITETLAPTDTLYRTDTEKSVNLVISKKENYDVLKLVSEIRDKAANYSQIYGEKVKVGISNDFSVYLNTRIRALGTNLFVGLFLVLIILTIFLPWQVTLVVAVGIPIALLSAILTINLAGLSLNLISLMGLIIVLGMLVDDAIVVSENIWRHIEDGEDVLDSVINGASEVFNPVFASILTTVSAFGPMLFMTGIFGSFVFEIPLMVILALWFSLLEAFFIMPSHFVSWVRPFVSNIKNKKSSKSQWFDKLTQRYRRYVAWSLDRRYLVLSIVSFIFIGSVAILVGTGRFVLFPSEDVEIFFVQVEAPKGVSLEKMETLVEPIEKSIFENIPESELLDVVTHIGIIQQDMMDPLTRRGSHYANVRVTLTAQSRRDRGASEIIEDLRGKLVKPEGIVKINYEPVNQGPPQGRPVSINIKGESFIELKKMADQFKEELGKIDGVVDIRDSYQMGKKEWQVIPNFEEASFGLSAADVSQSVRASFEGIVASSIRKLDEEIDIRVKLQKSEGEVKDQLEALRIGNREGNLVKLSALARFEQSQSLASIGHSDFKRVINVSAGVTEGEITGLQANDRIKPILDKIVMGQNGYSYESSGEDKDTQESMESLLVAFVFAACIIFSLLIITFKNLFQPLVILTSIPMGFVGVIWAMFIHGRPFSFMAMLGVIALAGVIVNNAIVFTDFVNRCREKGMGLNESIVESAGIRLRPIVLTTVTTICGLLPTAYGDKLKTAIDFVVSILSSILPMFKENFEAIANLSGGDPFVIPIALALGWGLAFGSLMTGFFFPAIVRILDDFRALVARTFKFG